MQISLSRASLKVLQNAKNLLAFSGGIDSSALFFILQNHTIPFDVAIVDYAKRTQSKQEVEYAKQLARTYKKACYLLTLDYVKSYAPSDSYCLLESFSLVAKSVDCYRYNLIVQPLDSNFEHQARKIRYDFFAFLIQTYSYNNLILAHHLDDKIEWFFMQFTKGSGLNSLLGFVEKEIRYTNKTSYCLLRPLIHVRKQELLAYNHSHNINYFIDSSNTNTLHKRNLFRNSLQNLFMQDCTQGIIRSFTYLHNEKAMLYRDYITCVDGDLLYCKRIKKQNAQHVLAQEIYAIDIMAKRLGYIMSAKQKAQVQTILYPHGCADSLTMAVKNHCKDCVIGGKIVVGINEELLFVGIWMASKMSGNNRDNCTTIPIESPNIQVAFLLEDSDLDTRRFSIPKKQREIYRKARIPKRIRQIMYRNSLL
ncbi:tRNA lysidine(34) synthetase TilS [Helicobacter aurati]|uniref:tRNA(Ile)-lysidine synthase n=1 Tax=Helicobacter aurati TaxID=137778 RepID=A0A3D8J882_9HELI|nr:tRNA lysidine(34) synthetase TilS [Helicobacter aurati]RDU73707.1 tRNA lysidine(34) synthetase TilS [Helicobacter aurati]